LSRSVSGLVASILVAATCALGAGAAQARLIPATSLDAHGLATCADYSNQKAAHEAADTRDADGDGIYCESLPCPCSTAAGGEDGRGGGQAGCTKPAGVRRLVFSPSKYPNIRRHFRAAVRRGWPRRLVLNRRGADARRDRLLEGYPTRDGYDRDEYPPAVGRGRGKGLMRGHHPRGWKADVRYVPSSENRSHGSSLGAKLRPFCDGTRFRYVFR
jgi:hypothetical protein